MTDVVFTANHLTDTNKLCIKYNSKKKQMPVTQNTVKQNYLLQHSARTQDWLILHLQFPSPHGAACR